MDNFGRHLFPSRPPPCMLGIVSKSILQYEIMWEQDPKQNFANDMLVYFIQMDFFSVPCHRQTKWLRKQVGTDSETKKGPWQGAVNSPKVLKYYSGWKKWYNDGSWRRQVKKL